MPCTRIGTDRDSYNTTLNRFARLQGAFPGAAWEDFPDTLRDMRAIKCADELGLLQRACDIDAIVRDGLRDAGLRSAYRDITRYSLGYHPQFTCRSGDCTHVLRPDDTWRLRPNMVFHRSTAAHAWRSAKRCWCRRPEGCG